MPDNADRCGAGSNSSWKRNRGRNRRRMYQSINVTAERKRRRCHENRASGGGAACTLTQASDDEAEHERRTAMEFEPAERDHGQHETCKPRPVKANGPLALHVHAGHCPRHRTIGAAIARWVPWIIAHDDTARVRMLNPTPRLARPRKAHCVGEVANGPRLQTSRARTERSDLLELCARTALRPDGGHRETRIPEPRQKRSLGRQDAEVLGEDSYLTREESGEEPVSARERDRGGPARPDPPPFHGSAASTA